MYDPLIMVMIKSTFLNLVNVLVRFNQLLWYFCSLPRIQYRHPPSHLLIKKKKNQRFRKQFCFSFHLRCCENENLWWFSPYPVTTTMIWPITDRIPHSSLFKRMQIKRIADNIRAFSFLLINWNKEPDEERIYRWTEVFSQVGQSSSSVGCRADDYELPPATTILCQFRQLPGPIMLSVSPKRCWMYLRNRVRCLPGFLFPCGGIYSAYSLHGSSSGILSTWPRNLSWRVLTFSTSEAVWVRS